MIFSRPISIFSRLWCTGDLLLARFLFFPC